MGNRFASGKWAIAQCDRCDQRFKLKQLRKEIIKTKNYELLVCPECWDPDQPQLQLGMFPVDDPQGLRNPRPDRSYYLSGTSGLQIVNSTSTDVNAQGTVEGGSRVFQWGWNPVGGAAAWDAGLTPNNLVLDVQLGAASVLLDVTPGAALGGVQATGAVGNALGPLAITGVQATGSVGDLGVQATGVQATGALGDMAASAIGATTGASGTGETGGIVPAKSYAVTGNLATGALGTVTGGVGPDPLPITGVSSGFTIGTPLQGVTVSKTMPGSQYQYYYSGQTGWSFRILWNTAENQALVLALCNEVANCTSNQIWLYANGQYEAAPASSQPEQCFGRIIGVSYQPNSGSAYFWLDNDALPNPQPQTGLWYTYSYVRVETRFSIPWPSNGGVYPDPPSGGYNPVYVNNGATCSLTWSGNAAKSLYDTYQSTGVSIVGSRVFGKWGVSFYDQQGNITLGVVTAATYNVGTGAFVIAMDTVTAVSSPTYYPLSIISFVPTNPGIVYIPSGVGSTGAVSTVAPAITQYISTPGQSVQFQGSTGGFSFEVSYASPTTPLGTWIATYGGYNYTYMFADIGGTYVGLGYFPGSWQLQFGAGSNLYWKGFVSDPIPSSNPGLGIWSFNNFVVAAQFFVDLATASAYASYSTAGGQATFTWTGNEALRMRDTYAQSPTLPVGTEISTILNFKDVNSVYTFRATLGTLLSMGYSSGTFSMTYTVVTPFTPAHNPIQYGDNWFASGITFLPLTINV